MLNIVNNDKLGLNKEVKNQNKDSLTKICNCFKSIRDKLKDELMDLLTIIKLKKDNEEFVKQVYEKKSEEFKKDMSYQKYCDNVENLIYDNISNNKDEIINNALNNGFNFYNYSINIINIIFINYITIFILNNINIMIINIFLFI